MFKIYLRNLSEKKREICSQVAICASVICLVYIFTGPISKSILDLGIHHVFSNIRLNRISQIFTILIGGIAIFRVFKQILKEELLPSIFSIINHATLGFCYLCIRNGGFFHFERIYENGSIYYFDVIVVFLPLFSWSMTRYGQLKTDSSSLRFIEDDFQKGEEDLYGRNNAIKNNHQSIIVQIANTIRNTTTKYAFSIAITGEWGSGKTTFLNSIIDEFAGVKDITVINFNPWKAGSKANIYECFFEELITGLKPHDKSAARELKKYAKSFAGAYEKNTLLKMLGSSDFLTGNDDLATRFREINSSIGKTGIRFVIAIDDLDRLTASEIIDVLKLIRSVANFGNVIFISAFDYSYIIKTVERARCITDVDGYLKKIFQYVFPLPPIRRTIMAEELKKLMRFNKMENEEKSRFTDALDKVSAGAYFPRDNDYFGILESALTNIRDLKRFVNSFQFSYNILKDEVEISDLIGVELIRLQHPQAYILLSTKKLVRRSKKNTVAYEVDDDRLEKDFRNYSQKEQLKKIMDFLFSSFGKSLRSIIYPEIFDIHIHYQLFNAISITDWQKARQRPLLEYYTILKQWTEEGKGTSLENLLKNIAPERTYSEYVKHIKVLLLLDDRKNGYFQFMEDVMYYLQYLFEYFSDKEWKTLVGEIINTPEIFNRTKAELCYRVIDEILKDRSGGIFDDKAYWQEQALSVLKQEIEKEILEYSVSVRSIHFSNLDYYEEGTRRLILTKPSNQLVKNYVLSHGAGFVKNLLQWHDRREDNAFMFDPWIKQVFDFPTGKSEFLEFVSSVESDDELVLKTKLLLRDKSDTLDNPNGYFILIDKKECEAIKELFTRRDNENTSKGK